MSPDMSKPRKIAGAAVAAALLISLVALWVSGDGGRAADEHRRAREAYQQRLGPTPLREIIAREEQLIRNSEAQIAELKELTGMAPVSPFIRPRRDSGAYIAYLIRFLHQELQLKAQTFAIDPRLGFNLLSTSPPPEDAAQGWLTMMQLVTKALFLCAEAPGRVDEVAITRLSTTPILTGPAGRPALLREYPFTLRITASLESISWLLLQFSSDARTEGNKDGDLINWLQMIERGVEAAGYRLAQATSADAEDVSIGPLIVRGFHITGSRIEENRVSALTVTIDLAGMDFLGDSERGTRPAAASRTGGAAARTRTTGTTATTSARPMARP